MEKRKILIVDDHKIVRDGLRSLIEIESDLEVVAEAANGKEAIDIISEKNEINLVVLDLSMPVIPGIGVLEHMKNKGISLPTLILSMHADMQYIQKCKDLGVKGYIFKDAEDDEILEAIRSVVGGGIYFSEKVRKLFSISVDIKSYKENLIHDLGITDSELSFINFMVAGIEKVEMIERLNSSSNEIENIKTSVMQKLGVSDELGLVREAMRKKIIE